ncbi:insulinase family protein [Vibrio sonorensis]|uniref:insulinase family protein n=1 Tax=Vibrio sonorensis TaxID=1004316 RepID=UPI0008D9041C|nr:insulinase family protein [Vibrio sonorensis]
MSTKRLFVLPLIIFSLLISTASAKSNSGYWFDATDLQLPKPTKVSQLNNGLRLVLLPLKRHPNQIAARLSIRYANPLNAQQKLATTWVALSIANDTQWSVEQHLDQTVFTLNLDDRNKHELFDQLALLSDKLTKSDRLVQLDNNTLIAAASEKLSLAAQASSQVKVEGLDYPQAITQFLPKLERLETVTSQDFNQVFHSYFTANQSSLIVVGDIHTRSVTDDIKMRFASWRRSTPMVTMQPEYSLASEAAVADQNDAPYRLQISVLKQITMDTDSKALRRDNLLDQMAAELMVKRLANLMSFEHGEAVSLQTRYLTSDRALLSITLTADSNQALQTLKDKIEADIDRVSAMSVSADEYYTVVQATKQRLKTSTFGDMSLFTSNQADMLVEAIRLGQVYLPTTEILELASFHAAHISEVDLSQRLIQLWTKPSIAVYTASNDS